MFKRNLSSLIFLLEIILALGFLVAFFVLVNFYISLLSSPFIIYVDYAKETNLLGGVDEIYQYGIFGIVVFLINLALALMFFTRKMSLSLILGSATLAVEALIFLGGLQVYLMNI